MKSIVAALSLAATAAFAQPAANDALWRDLGGTEGIQALAGRLLPGRPTTL